MKMADDSSKSIGNFCNNLAAFCNHLQSSSDALKQSVDRRPIPLDSASTTFMQSLNRRLSSTSGDLNLLESMSFDTVSFEELLGHCTQVYNQNQIDLLALQDHLVSTSSFVPSADTDEGEKELDDFSPDIKSSALPLNKLEDDLLLDDNSLSLKNLGLSDACLATIASEADDNIEKKATYQSGANLFTEIKGETGDQLKPFEDSRSLISVCKDDYENLPKHIKSLASWEDLSAAVEKMNSCLSTRNPKLTFHQDEIASLGLGCKARSYLLLLIRMEHIVVETIDGVIHYRILPSGE